MIAMTLYLSVNESVSQWVREGLTYRDATHIENSAPVGAWKFNLGNYDRVTNRPDGLIKCYTSKKWVRELGKKVTFKDATHLRKQNTCRCRRLSIRNHGHFEFEPQSSLRLPLLFLFLHWKVCKQSESARLLSICNFYNTLYNTNMRIYLSQIWITSFTYYVDDEIM